MPFHTLPFRFLVLLLFLFMGIHLGCSGSDEKKSDTEEQQSEAKKNAEESFFPVTAFLSGEIREMWELGTKVSSVVHEDGKNTHNVWQDDTLSWKKSFQDFFTPPIDSIRLGGTYRLSKFMDETIHAVTLSYERNTPITTFPEWNNWNVYIEPETGTVKKLFLVKKLDISHLQQLTWKHGQGCLIRDFDLDSTGQMVLKKEQEYSWK
jgi:hypothetical protein